MGIVNVEIRRMCESIFNLQSGMHITDICDQFNGFADAVITKQKDQRTFNTPSIARSSMSDRSLN